MVWRTEFPFATVPVPHRLQLEARGIAGDEGLYLLQEAWIHPGIETETLLCQAAGVTSFDRVPQETKRALWALDEKLLISEMFGHHYLTGRNPKLFRSSHANRSGISFERGFTLCWSDLF